MYNVNQIADYTIFRLSAEEESGLVNLKLQKLLYYIQAWHLAFNNYPLFDGKFQAWIHGPVNREIYNRFKDTKYLYSSINLDDIDIQSNNLNNTLPEDVILHINNVLDAYAPFSATDLEIMTHREEPWLQARKGFNPQQRCEREIDEKIMGSYYRKRLEDGEAKTNNN